MKDKKLKVLVVVTEFPSVSETFILNQIADLIDKGHQVTVFSYNESSDSVTHQLYYDYHLDKKVFTHFKNRKGKLSVLKGGLSFLYKNFKSLNFSVLFSLLNIFKWKENKERIKIYYDFPLYLLQERYDVLHCHFGFNGVKIARAEKRGIKIANKKVLSFHGSDMTPSKLNFYKELYRDVFTVFDAITVNSPYLQKLILSIHPTIKNLHILPVGFCYKYIDLNPKNKIDNSTFNVVFCGRLIALKGPDKAIEIIHQLVSKGYKNVKLHLIGSGEMFTFLQEKVSQLKLQNNIILYGSLAQKEVYNIMSSADAFILPGNVEPETGRAETQGLVIQEAQYFRLPVVVSDVGGIRYGMLKNESGFLVDSKDMPIFVEKLIELMENPVLKKEMGEKGHEYVKEKFSSDKLGDQLIKIYEN